MCSIKQTIFNYYATNLKMTISHRNLRISGVERYIRDMYLMFLSREIDIKQYQIYTKIHVYAILFGNSRLKQIIFSKVRITSPEFPPMAVQYTGHVRFSGSCGI